MLQYARKVHGISDSFYLVRAAAADISFCAYYYKRGHLRHDVTFRGARVESTIWGDT